MDNRITAVIIEDNLDSRAYLSQILENELSFVSILGSATGVSSGIEVILDTQPDVVFLDIQLDDGYGFEILEKVDSLSFEVVFVSGLDQYYQKAFEHFALSYITKPYTPYEIVRVMNRVRAKKAVPTEINQQKAFTNFMGDLDVQFLLHVGNEHITIKLSNVVKCVSDGNYTQFCMDNGEQHLASKVLKYYEQLFEQKGFVRVNRATIINISHIQKVYKKETLTMSNGDHISLSPVYVKKFGSAAGTW